ncbi:hypothetical protein PROFUN_01623 [Planoprotostelium fungivorum]|uniref:Coiled-coil domain-containing protein 39 n=1 Tax=Planoprotostelium fungivorum TaxID=1890364 RepID=A0A2P6NTT0_9EUKA|nr:hypothetical protein PROFUN_01623 [Planoprotostelium fungivorum]
MDFDFSAFENDFDTNDTLPPFASDFNKQLDREVRERQAYLEKISKSIEEHQNRMGLMKEHLKNVNTELSNTQSLQTAKANETKSEERLQKLYDREKGKLKADIDKLSQRHVEYQDREKTLQNAIVQAQEKFENFRSQLKMGKEQLEQWAIAKKQKEDDTLVMLRYAHSDDIRIKELNMQVSKLTKEAKIAEGRLEAEVTETRAAQIELDKTGEEFKNLQREREQLLFQWEEAIQSMEKLDETIQKSLEQLEGIKEQIGSKQAVIDEKKKFLQTEEANNRELEGKIGAADRMLTKLRSDYGGMTAMIEEYQSELDTVKGVLSKTNTTLEEQRSEIMKFNREIDLKRKRIEKLQVAYEKTKYDLETHYSKSENLEDRAKQLDMYYKNEEHRLNRAEKEQRQLQESLFEESQAYYKARQLEQGLLSDLNGAKAAEKNLQAKIAKLDAESLKQQELIYNQEYQLQQLERKISRAQGERTNEERAALNARIKELTVDLDRRSEQYNLLNGQQKKIEDDVRTAKRNLEVYLKKRAVLKQKITDMELENESSARNLKATGKKHEELLVAENFVRLDVKRLRDLLYHRADEVFNLESRKIQLQSAMESRKQEIQVHKDALRAQLRLIEEEVHLRTKELGERLEHIDKRKRKYQILMMQINPEGEEEHTQAYYIIKAAQQKEELQKEKDSLDTETQRVIDENRMLEASLASFNAVNQRLHMQKTRGGMTAEDLERSSDLSQRLRNYQAEEEERARERFLLEAEVSDLERRGSDIEVQCQQSIRHIDALRAKVHSLSADTSKHQTQVQRARAILIKKKSTPPSVVEKECKYIELRHKNNLELSWLLQLSQAFPTIREELENQLALHNIKPPQRPATSNSLLNSPSNSRPETPRSITSRGSINSTTSGHSRMSTANSRVATSQVMSLDMVNPSLPGQPRSNASSRNNSRPTSAQRLPRISQLPITTNMTSSPPMSPNGSLSLSATRVKLPSANGGSVSNRSSSAGRIHL